jgi:hypothetical protein
LGLDVGFSVNLVLVPLLETVYTSTFSGAYITCRGSFKKDIEMFCADLNDEIGISTSIVLVLNTSQLTSKSVNPNVQFQPLSRQIS